MGCDIHVHTEVKLDGVWEHYGNPDVGRYYALFEKMAGMRGDEGRALSLPKGMPGDASRMTMFECEVFGSDGHSHSWLSSQEIAELYKWWDEEVAPCHDWASRWKHVEQQFGYLFGNAWFKENMREQVTDFRWVFWFDN